MMFQPPSGGPPYAVPHHAASLLSLDNFMLLDATTNTFRHFNDDSNSSIKKAVHRVISTNPGDTIEIMSMILLTRAIPPGQQQPEATTTGTRIVGPSEPPNNSPDASTNVTVPEPVSIDFSKFKSPAGSRCSCTICKNSKKRVLESDLLPGGNGRVGGHAANKYFQAVINANKIIYRGIPDGSKKIFSQKVQQLLERDIRFLKTKEDNKTTRTRGEILEKIQQALREKPMRKRGKKSQATQKANKKRKSAVARIDNSNDEDKRPQQERAKDTHDINNNKGSAVIDETTNHSTTQISNNLRNLNIGNEPSVAAEQNEINDWMDTLSGLVRDTQSVLADQSNNHSTGIILDNSSQILNLSFKKFSASNVKELAKELKINSTLQHLNLSNNEISDIGAKEIADALKGNSTLQSLSLSDNKISNNGAKEIADALIMNSMLKELYLSNNNISDDGAKEIADALILNSTLQRLDLGGNEISNNGAKEIADALKVNSTLRTLGLSGNGISKEAVKDEKRIKILY